MCVSVHLCLCPSVVSMLSVGPGRFLAGPKEAKDIRNTPFYINFTVAILAQGTHWADAVTQACFCRFESSSFHASFCQIPQGDGVPVFLGFLPSLMLCSSSSACGSWPYSRGARPVSLATFYTSFENQKKHWCYVSVTPPPPHLHCFL